MGSRAKRDTDDARIDMRGEEDRARREPARELRCRICDAPATFEINGKWRIDLYCDAHVPADPFGAR